jgi:hypothetical protein
LPSVTKTKKHRLKNEIENKTSENKNRKTKAMKRVPGSRHEFNRVPLTTKNENEMKTKNNVQKTILRSAAVIVSFVLISFTVSAQDFWKRLL